MFYYEGKVKLSFLFPKRHCKVILTEKSHLILSGCVEVEGGGVST